MPPPLDHWLSRSDFTPSDYLFSDMMNNLANDIRYWGGNVNGGGYILSNVILEGSGGFQYTASPITLTQGGDGETRLELRQGTGAASLLRWALTKDATAETGANAGSNFNLNRYNDAGAFLGTPFSINRATGVITMGAQHWTGPIDGGGQTITNVVIPGVSGQVSSVFTRIGAVVAAAGDYTAAQVTNAVSTQGSYADPGWITSLAYSKITGVPVAPVTSVFTRVGAISAAAGDYTAAQVTNAVSTQGSYADPIWLTSLSWGKITGAPTVTSATYYVNGTFVASRPTLNLVAGTGTILSGSVDQSGPNRVDVTVTATGAGGGLPQTPWASDIVAAGFTLRGAGRIGAGVTPPDSRLMLSNNAVAPPVPTAGTIAHLAGADADNTRILMDSFGGASNLTLRSSGGTAAALTALASGAVLGTVSFQGYGTTGYSASGRGAILATAAENWSDSAQGAVMVFYTTPIGSTSMVERVRIAADGKVGIGMTPAWPLDVTGDCNITGTYRVNGLPLATGGGGSQTPWTSDIVAAGNSLHRVKGIGIGPTNNAADGFGIIVDSLTIFDGFKQLSSSPNGWAGFSLQNDAGTTLSFRVYGSTRATPNLAKLESSGAFTFDTAANERMRITTGGLVGIGKAPSTYRLEVAGDIDITGTYRVNGLPLSTGGNQTPWTSDIATAGFALTHTTSTPVIVNSLAGAGNGSFIQFKQSGVSKGFIGYYPNAPTGIAVLDPGGSGNALMLITAAGNVGFGTSSPLSRLSVIGPANPSTIATANQITIGEPTNNPDYRLSLGYCSIAGTGANQGLIQATSGAVGSPLLLNPAGGNVGISTVSPTTLLSTGIALAPIKISLYDGGPTSCYGIGVMNGILTFGSGINPASGTPQMVLASSGYVGINCGAPSALLSINSIGTPQTFATANQISIGESSNTGGYKFNIGYAYNLTGGGVWSGVLQSLNGSAGSPLYINPSGAGVVMGQAAAPHAGSILTLFNGSPGTVATSNQLFIGEGSNNSAYGLCVGFGNFSSTNGWAGSIQANVGGATGTLCLNPAGGPVFIGMTGAPAVFATAVYANLGVYQTANVWIALGLDPGSFASNPITGLGIYYDTTNSVGRLEGLSGGIAWRGWTTCINGGNFGIGVAAPAYKLDVLGIAQASVGVRCNQKGNNLFGNAAGAATGVTAADSCIQLYNYASNNWAGMGCDVGGSVWFHTNYGTNLYLPVSGGVSINTTSASYNLTMGADSAGKPGSNVWTVISDGRLKRDIRPFTDGLEAILKLRPMHFTYNDDADEGYRGDAGVGLVAQEVAEIFPSWLRPAKGKLAGEDTEVLGLNNNEMQYMMLNALREINERLKKLEAATKN